VWWVAAWTLLLGVQLAAAFMPGESAVWESPITLFVIVVIAASGCAVAAGVVLVVAHRHDLAELGMIGAFTMAVSMLPLVHGLTTPGVLYGDNAATMSSVFWALPLAALSVVALIAPRSSWSRWLSRRWRVGVFAHVTVTMVLSAALLIWPNMIPAPSLRSERVVGVAVAALVVCLALSVRQLRLSWISGSGQPFVVSLGFAFVGVASLVWVSRAPYTAGFWLAHAFDIMGVLLVAVGALVAFRQRAQLHTLIRPLTVHTPLAAFELGLEPLVHRFVALLETKDAITRDHVVRSAELAMEVGQELGVPARDLHVLGLGALLHDIGKLAIPSDIINKPGRLDPEEFAVMRGHAMAGEQLVRQSGVLVDIAPIVRGHHERVDGRGYPDGLVGDDIPALARIVSVVDAFDAMSHTRQYREGLGEDRAVAILREHAGSQWDERVVEALIATIRRGDRSTQTLQNVGRSAPAMLSADVGCACFDVIPDSWGVDDLVRTARDH
jgi:putative nucleotidyltransferase with HDIG domain